MLSRPLGTCSICMNPRRIIMLLMPALTLLAMPVTADGGRHILHCRCFDVTLAAGAGECTAFISEDGCRMNDSGEILEGDLADALLGALARIESYLEHPKGTCSREPAA